MWKAGAAETTRSLYGLSPVDGSRPWSLLPQIPHQIPHLFMRQLLQQPLWHHGNLGGLPLVDVLLGEDEALRRGLHSDGAGGFFDDDARHEPAVLQEEVGELVIPADNGAGVERVLEDVMQ